MVLLVFAVWVFLVWWLLGLLRAIIAITFDHTFFLLASVCLRWPLREKTKSKAVFLTVNCTFFQKKIVLLAASAFRPILKLCVKLAGATSSKKKLTCLVGTDAAQL